MVAWPCSHFVFILHNVNQKCQQAFQCMFLASDPSSKGCRSRGDNVTGTYGFNDEGGNGQYLLVLNSCSWVLRSLWFGSLHLPPMAPNTSLPHFSQTGFWNSAPPCGSSLCNALELWKILLNLIISLETCHCTYVLCMHAGLYSCYRVLFCLADLWRVLRLKKTGIRCPIAVPSLVHRLQ